MPRCLRLRLLDLPADVWHVIGTYLPPDGVFHRVCRLPPDVLDAVLPRHVDTSVLLRPAFAQRMGRLVTLAMHDTFWTPTAWQLLVERLPASLASLKLRRCNVPWEGLHRLAERLVNLDTLWIEEVLNLNVVTLPSLPDTPTWIATLVESSGATLRSLSLENNDLILTPESLRTLLACPLEELRLAGNYAYWSDSLRLHSSLRRLCIGTNPATGEGPATLMASLTHPLEALALQYEVMPQPCMCRHLLQFAPHAVSSHLKTLRIRGNVVAFGGSWEVTCRALRDVLRLCPALETLDLVDSVVSVSFLCTIFKEAGPALRCFRVGLCMVDSSTAPPSLPASRQMHTFRAYWNVPPTVLDCLRGLVDLDISHLKQTRGGLARVLRRNASTLRRLRLDHAVLSYADAFLCGRALSSRCHGLEELSIRHWSAESSRALLHGILSKTGGLAGVRQWQYNTVYMDSELMELYLRVMARCTRLERYEYVRGATVLPQSALYLPMLRVWDFHASGIGSADVQKMLACLARGASPLLAEWRLDHNLEINDDAFANFEDHWSKRPSHQRDRLRVLSLKNTGVTCHGLQFIFTPHLRLRVLEALGALSSSFYLETCLMSLLRRGTHVVAEQVRLPFALYGLIDPDILHRLLNRGIQVLPYELTS